MWKYFNVPTCKLLAKLLDMELYEKRKLYARYYCNDVY